MPTAEYKEALARVEQLPLEDQQHLLDEVALRVQRAVTAGHPTATPAITGTPGANLLKYAGSIDPASLRAMEQAIEEGCERIEVSDQ